MDIFEFAMRMEKDGETYYRENAQDAGHPGLTRILLMLADDEVRHFQVIEKMAEGSVPGLADTQVLVNARNIFQEMKDKGEKFDPEIEQKKLYFKAGEIEKKSEEFYRAKALEAGNEGNRKLFIQLAEQEKKHFMLLENILEFVSQPDMWIENAEFNKLGEY